MKKVCTSSAQFDYTESCILHFFHTVLALGKTESEAWKKEFALFLKSQTNKQNREGHELPTHPLSSQALQWQSHIDKRRRLEEGHLGLGPLLKTWAQGTEGAAKTCQQEPDLLLKEKTVFNSKSRRDGLKNRKEEIWEKDAY